MERQTRVRVVFLTFQSLSRLQVDLPNSARLWLVFRARSPALFGQFNSLLRPVVSFLSDLVILSKRFPHLLLVRVLVLRWKLIEKVQRSLLQLSRSEVTCIFLRKLRRLQLLRLFFPR